MNNQHKDILLFIVCIIFPPLAMFLMVGFSLHFFINLILCFIGYFPGMFHALWMFFQRR
jgi:uncharacterized membrane protein YqaE (UPF0057 family)